MTVRTTIIFHTNVEENIAEKILKMIQEADYSSLILYKCQRLDEDGTVMKDDEF